MVGRAEIVYTYSGFHTNSDGSCNGYVGIELKTENSGITTYKAVEARHVDKVITNDYRIFTGNRSHYKKVYNREDFKLGCAIAIDSELAAKLRGHISTGLAKQAFLVAKEANLLKKV